MRSVKYGYVEHTSAGRVVGDLVTHDLHDVVAVGDETERQGGGQNSELPDGDRSLGLGGVTGAPGRVDDSPGSDSVTNIVGTVSKRGSAGSENLDKGVGVLDLVGVLGGMAVDTLHTSALGSSVDTSLGSVDVVVYTVEAADDEHCGNTLKSDDHVLLLVDLAGLNLVLVEVAHGPSEGTLLRAELGVEAFLTLSDEFLVAELAVLGNDGGLLSILGFLLHDTVVRVAEGTGLDVLIVLDNGVVTDVGSLDAFRSRPPEEKRAHENVVPANRVVALDDNGVEVRDEEDERQKSETNTAGDGDSGDIPGRLLVETEVGRSLVDDGERANSTGDEEEEGSGPDSPGDGVLAEVNSELDQHEDDSTEACRGGGSHSETCKDGTETLALVPTPLDVLSTSDGNTNTSDGRDKRVRRRDVSRVLGAPHDPDRGTSQSAGECKHLNTSIALEGGGRNDSVLDGVGGTGTDSDGTYHLEDSTQNHGLAVRDGARRDRGGPRVGNIVWYVLVGEMGLHGEAELTGTVVVGIEHGKEGANGEDIVVLGELRHGYCGFCWLQVALGVLKSGGPLEAGMQKRAGPARGIYM